MSTPFNVMALARQAGIHLTGGFAVVAECVTLDELERFAQTAISQAINTTTTQRTWVGLTDAEIKEIVGPYGDTPIKGYTRQLFDQIEAMLKERNT